MQPTLSVQSAPRSIFRIAAQARFFTFSVLVHTALVIFAGSFVMFHRVENPPDFEASDSSMVMEAQQQSEPPAGGSQASAPQLAPPAPTVSPQLPSVDAIATASPLSNFQLGSVGPGNINLGKVRDTGGGGADLSKSLSGGLGKGAMGRIGGTSTVKFFGKDTQVQAVVFVVDISGSMISGAKSAKTYEELEDEVKRVIRRLDSRTLFGIVAFSRDASLYKPELVAATGDEKQRAINWLRKQSPVEMTRTTDEDEKQKHHGTRADKGLEAAFNLKPDTIFFVSDGEPTGANPAAVLKMVTQWQKPREKPVSINAVAYLADGGQKFMGDLAKQNGGTFREINPDSDRK